MKGITYGSRWSSDKMLYLGRKLEEPGVEGFTLLARVVGGDNWWLSEVVQGDSQSTPDRLCCLLSRVYFPNVIQALVVESGLNVPDCCQPLPTGIQKSGKSLGFSRGVPLPQATAVRQP